MRRGHAGIGGWRNENTRHFRPRTGGSPHFRPPARNFGLLETPRFPPPGFRGPPPFSNHPNQSSAEHHERSKYRSDHRPTNQYNRAPDRSHHQSQRSIFPLIDRLRHKDGPNHSNQYQDNNYFDKASRDQFHINSMGDIDDRHQAMMSKIPESFGRPPILQWPNHPEMKRQFFDERNQFNKQYKHHDNPEGLVPLLDYPGHRPPSSDHYGGNTSSSIDNSNSFSRSVDDTVDIIRKRLQNRNEAGEDQTLESQPIDHHDEDLRIPSSICQKNSQEPPVKKRIQRQRHDRPAHGESNCDKMKTTIVHELFKMDKDRIHKLMDNPSSSSKFEYAISSLITESQNSLNKHMRSVAEKSLSASDDFIHNDNNTIYEDTFMKQMQHILEPQDTVLLEDIKPLVLAELSKVLQLNEYDQPFQMIDDRQGPMHEHQIYDSSEPNFHNYIDFSQNQYYDQVDSPPVGFEDYVNTDTDHRHLIYDEPEQEKPKPLFERRPVNPVIGIEKRPEPCFSPEDQCSRVNLDSSISQEEFPSFTSERRHSRRSMDSRHSEDKNKRSEAPVPLFDTNAVPFSEDEDPFAELDNQYHVAVDHNFIDYNMSSPQGPTHSNTSRSSSKNRDTSLKTPTKDHVSVEQEIDNQLLNNAKSPLKLPSIVSTEAATNNENLEFSVGIKQEIKTEPKTADDHLERSENIETPSKTAMALSSRKRSVDQKPSHRKEKRKKSETCLSDSNQQILNKNIIINVNDCAAKDKQKCKETAKSIFNLFFSKDENSKDVPKDTKPVDKSNSAKYVKRKEPHRKSNEKEDEQKARKRSLSSSHSMVSPKDSTNNNMLTIKTECSKTKLQSIDMFSEQQKKASSKHLSHKNTGVSPETPTKQLDVSKSKQPVLTFNKKVTKRHVSTQVIRKIFSRETQTFGSKSSSSRYCQTEKKKSLDKKVQTDPVFFEKSSSKATDTFERMKEIDMEIQGLLQEKFKLYSSLESNASCPSTIQNLGMTVLNVNEVTQSSDENNSENSGDAVADDFTSIPVEELEQIALESVNEPPEPPHLGKKTRKHERLSESRANSSSPSAKTYSRKVSKAPNISLLEQILIDDRPLEDIISLDDLETTPVKPKKKSAKLKKKSHKKSSKLDKKLLTLVVTGADIKECSVVLKREDLTRYLKAKPSDEARKTEELPVITIEDEQVENDQSFASNVIEETVVSNDIQFDMLDVSEDIIIGEMCEMKCGDKETERIEVATTEDIILDNSQPSEPLQSEGGPGDNVCKMYDYSTDENLRRDALTVSGHADAVLAIECIENNFVVACLDGNVYHFNGDGQLLATLRGSNLAVTCLTIVKEKYGTTVYTGSLDSRIRYFDLETGLEKGPECNVLSPIQTMDRAWDTIFVGTRTGFVLQFECKNNMLIPVSTVKFSDQSILALRAMKEGPRKVLLVAARSEDVTIKDAQTGLLLRSLQGPKMTVYTLLYEEGKVYCGTSSHQIHVFDYASGTHAGAHYGGKGAVCLRASGGLLFAGCYDGCVYVYREGEPRPLAQLRGPGLMLLSLAVVGSKIIAGYKDRSLYIWKIPLSILQEMIL